MSELKKRITADMKSAMKAKDKQSLKAIRMLLGAIKQKEIDERTELDDVAVVAVVQKMLKQRKDSIAQFKDAARDDLVASETAELEVISGYMPEQMNATEVEAAVDQVIANTGSNSMRDMGKLMGILKGKLAGKADMSTVSSLIKAKLS